MSKARNKPAREKRKPKKDKNALSKDNRGGEVLDHISQHPPPEPRS